MNNIIEVINELNLQMIDTVLKGIDDNFKQIIESNYLEYLKKQYLEKYKDYNDLNKLYKLLLDFENRKWKNLTSSEKMSYLILDEALEKIKSIASIAFNLASNRKENGELASSNLVDSYLEQLSAEQPRVSEFNKSLAEWYISEGTMDLLYASGRTDNTSLRIGH